VRRESPNLLSPSPHLNTETDAFSEKLCFLVISNSGYGRWKKSSNPVVLILTLAGDDLQRDSRQSGLEVLRSIKLSTYEYTKMLSMDLCCPSVNLRGHIRHQAHLLKDKRLHGLEMIPYTVARDRTCRSAATVGPSDPFRELQDTLSRYGYFR
jgi:hypothetical protein